MEYRKEIDGLRAIAVLSVILAHAGFELFRGGFIGVDIFFVISGYLITSILYNDLANNAFSIRHFYERRARRILPVLFTVMLVSVIAGHFFLMPDEYKNLGQSLVATSLFSNNILLGITSDYWELASDFKPLLHTWSLGIEEQYYLIIPFALWGVWKFQKKFIPHFLTVTFILSLSFSILFVSIYPQWAFYLLPTRAWELALGGIAAIYLRFHPFVGKPSSRHSIYSFIGFAAMISSIFLFDSTTPTPSYPILLPTLGTFIVILFTNTHSFTHRILTNQWLVYIGLMSYSLYLWHQPIFAYLRVLSFQKPTDMHYLRAIPLLFAFSYFSWKYIETPFRNKSIVNQRTILNVTLMGSFFFISAGLFLNQNYGFPNRIFDSSIHRNDMDRRIYNERAYAFQADSFPDTRDAKILIIGNSFARDFVNITIETFITQNIKILYRPDLDECIQPYQSPLAERLFSKADAIVFASGIYDNHCIPSDLLYAKLQNKKVFYIGIKDFGYNLNWVIRSPKEDLPNLYNPIADSIIQIDVLQRQSIPQEHFISYLQHTLIENKIPITDEFGRMLSTDKAHLTKYGAIYFGKKVVAKTAYSDLFK